MNKVVQLANTTNGAKDAIDLSQPYSVALSITGSADFLFHRWNTEAVAEKAKAAKNSAAKKSDNVESYVYRNDSGELCIPGHAAITGDDVEALERQLDHYNDDLPPLKDFILPAGGEAASRCHLARTIVRRAERETVTLARHDAVRPEAIRYLNRLSDLLFVLARVLARADGQGEVLWKHERRHA